MSWQLRDSLTLAEMNTIFAAFVGVIPDTAKDGVVGAYPFLEALLEHVDDPEPEPEPDPDPEPESDG